MVIGNAIVGGVVKGVQRDFSLVGVWGCLPPAILIPPLLEERRTGGEVNGDSSTPQDIALQDPFLYHVVIHVIITVMLNLFQHLSFQCVIPEIPKQVRNDREQSPIGIAIKTFLSL